jgi:hypothetical protein
MLIEKLKGAAPRLMDATTLSPPGQVTRQLIEKLTGGRNPRLMDATTLRDRDR